MSVDDDHTRAVATVAGEAAARKLAELLGFDVSTPKEIEQVRRDMYFLRDLRVGTAAVKRRAFIYVIGAIVTALMAYAAIGFRVGH